ncbi:helix-turn-helix domain-containing protein [Alicyclobacillus fastidiosus]|uniref:Helix-turn-helix domain-containing protein n=1 Tax=Alicyclobacillus fastidiosus TaxID=392011 RepID=A0ABY6ZKP8_9BACL|nr:helix-turn-helix domain-containing protein [Alicyclobacillus fastidiosus]WAH42686.1 helix-turn-helix domain-containing protein [Alicyclobacillus fastidiosus]GMA64570.1 transcriptional regulator [Alicyclobacillus fastidiosus]
MPIQSGQNAGERTLTVSLDDFVEIAKALSSDLRVSIFKLLLTEPKNVAEIAEIFDIPPSTAAINVRKLEEVNLIKTDLVPGTRGTQKLCMAVYSKIIVDTPSQAQVDDTQILIPMSIGNFFDFDVAPTCGILSEHSIIGEFDDPRAFSEPNRTDAQLIWFKHGYVEYRFPNRAPHGKRIKNLELTMELCSEAPLHRANWPSDITLWINNQEVGTWTSPGDFGGERGLLTPDWWLVQNTQFGLLKTWRINMQGSFIDGVRLSDVTIADVNLDGQYYIAVRIGVKADAENVGGVNIFGRKFGNYATDILMRLECD